MGWNIEDDIFLTKKVAAKYSQYANHDNENFSSYDIDFHNINNFSVLIWEKVIYTISNSCINKGTFLTLTF